MVDADGFGEGADADVELAFGVGLFLKEGLELIYSMVELDSPPVMGSLSSPLRRA
jgi:hypothetical protein